MSLDLDARQRAMLQEMGVPVWWPAPAAPTAGARAAAPSSATTAAPLPEPAAPPAPNAYSAAPAVPQASTPVRTAPAPSTAGAAVAPGSSSASQSAPLWTLGAPQWLFAQADPVHTPAHLGTGWLLVAEDTGSSDPWAGDAGLLLHNMLHALRLHRHPRVFLCTLQAPLADPALAPPDTALCAEALAQALAHTQPGVVLVMGRAAARAVLGRSEPLGQLRALPHTVGGVPAVVTYGTTYLLRAPAATKAQAWADLCRARALVAGEAMATPP